MLYVAGIRGLLLPAKGFTQSVHESSPYRSIAGYSRASLSSARSISALDMRVSASFAVTIVYPSASQFLVTRESGDATILVGDTSFSGGRVVFCWGDGAAASWTQATKMSPTKATKLVLLLVIKSRLINNVLLSIVCELKV